MAAPFTKQTASEFVIIIELTENVFKLIMRAILGTELEKMCGSEYNKFMQTTENMQDVNMGKSRMLWIMAIVLVIPILFFGSIQWFDLDGWTLYFAQLGVYVGIYLLAFWGLKTERISLPLSGRKAFEAVGIVLVSWLVYLAVLLAFGFDFSLDDTRSLIILARVVSTWLFVGLAEELLFRGYLFAGIKRYFTTGDDRRRTMLAVVWSSVCFSVWHLPVRLVSLFSGELGIGLLLISLVILFVYGMGFAFLFHSSENILLVGLVHGLMDYPLIGKDSQLSFILLIVAILLVLIGGRSKR